MVPCELPDVRLAEPFLRWQMSVADQPVRPEVDDVDFEIVPAALGGPADLHAEWLRPTYSQVLTVQPHLCEIV